MNRRSVLVAVSLDESGSMGKWANDTISGYNTYIGGLMLADPQAPFVYTAWDSHRYTQDRVCTIAQARRLNRHNYVPGAMTPLYDSVMRLISYVEEVTQEGQTALIVVITDGEENDSRRYGLADVKRAIERKQEAGWLFVFMGANQDAWLTGEGMGVRRGTTQTFKQDKTVELFEGLAAATVSYINNPKALPDEFWDATDATRFGGKNRMTY